MQEIMENIIISDSSHNINLIQWLKDIHDIATGCIVALVLILLCVLFIAWLNYLEKMKDK